MSKSVKNASNFIERKQGAMYAKIDTWQNRAARLLFILMCIGVPMFLAPSRYIELPMHKWNFFMFSIAVVVLCAIGIWAYRLTRKPRLGLQDSFNIADWAILAFALVTIITTIVSPFTGVVDPFGFIPRPPLNVWIGIQEPDGRYDGALTQLSYVAIFFIISRWYKPRAKDFMWLGAGSIFISLIGIFQFFGMDFFTLWPTHLPQYRMDNLFNIHLRTTLGNTNTVSVFTTLVVLITGFLFVRKKSKYQPLWLASSAITFWMFVIAGADSGMIGMIAAMLVAIPFVIQTAKMLGRTLILASSWAAAYTIQVFLFETVTIQTRQASTLLPFAAGVIVLLAAGLILNLKGKEPDLDAPPKWKLGVILIVLAIAAGLAGVELLGRPGADGIGGGVLYEAREILHGRIRDEFGTNRIYIWRHALSIIPNNPIIGTGPDTFHLAFPLEAQGYLGESYFNAHNEYIQYLVTHGILGLVAYLLFVGAVIVKSVRKAFSDPIITAVFIAFIGYLAQAFFNISHPIASQILWVLAGILLSRRLNEDGRFEE